MAENLSGSAFKLIEEHNQVPDLSEIEALKLGINWRKTVAVTVFSTAAENFENAARIKEFDISLTASACKILFRLKTFQRYHS